jgi:hypothetical protein
MRQKPREVGPSPTDRAGWRRAAREERLGHFRMEEIVAAIQAMLRDNDPSLVNTLIGYVSDALMKMLTKRVSRNHRNGGKDIIERAHDDLIEAILKPDSADGIALRTTFGSCVRFRLADAIRGELLNEGREPSYELDANGDPIEPADDASWRLIGANAEVEIILSKIEDRRKRLAFWLYSEDVPYESKKGASIGAALGISEKTAREWVDEVKTQLKQILEAQHDQERHHG